MKIHRISYKITTIMIIITSPTLFCLEGREHKISAVLKLIKAD